MADFKPLKIGDEKMKTEQQDRVNTVNAAWIDDPVVKNLHPYWNEWIRWFEGDQYTTVNEVTGELHHATKLDVGRDTMNVYNHIVPIIRQQWGELRYDHQFYLEPNTIEREDILAAKIGSMCIEWTNYNGKFKRKINLAKLYALIMGNVFWKEFWNSSLKGYVSKDNGKTLTEVDGDVDFDFVNAFNCRPDPNGNSRNEWRWFTEGKRLPTSAIAEEFADKGGPDAKDIPGERKEQQQGTGLFERENFKETDEPTAVRKEYYERPSKDHPKGRMLVVVGQWLMYEGPNPNPKEQIPYFHFKGILPMIDELWGDSSVRLGQASQRQLNRLCSQVDEQFEHYGIKAMIPWGSLRGEELRAFKRAGVEYVIYNARAGQPYYQLPPSISADMINWISRQADEIETQMSVRKISLAEWPKGARGSGVLFQGLKQQDEVVLLPTIEDWDGVLEDAMRFRLELIEKHYTLPRMVKIFGKKVETSINFFKGADLHGNTDVRVKPGVDIFTNKQMKREIVQMLIEKGVIEDAKEAFELMQTGGVEEFLEDQFIDRKQASRHLEIMKTKPKPYIAAMPDDNHEVGFEVFNNFRKTAEYEQMDEEKREFVEKRMKEHQDFMNVKAEEATTDEAAILAEKEAEFGATGGPVPGGLPGGMPTDGGAAVATMPPNIPPEIAQVIAEIQGIRGG